MTGTAGQITTESVFQSRCQQPAGKRWVGMHQYSSLYFVWRFSRGIDVFSRTLNRTSTLETSGSPKVSDSAFLHVSGTVDAVNATFPHIRHFFRPGVSSPPIETNGQNIATGCICSFRPAPNDVVFCTLQSQNGLLSPAPTSTLPSSPPSFTIPCSQ